MQMSHTALIVIDMQEDYVGKRSRNNCYSAEFIDKVNERIEIAAKQNETIIYVRNTGRRQKKPYVSPLVTELKVVSDFLIDKETASAFCNDNIRAILKERQVHKIEVIGIDGNACVAASAMDASKLGYEVVFPLEYIGIKNMERFDITREKLIEARVEVI